jgi:hypothetical protein
MAWGCQEGGAPKIFVKKSTMLNNFSQEKILPFLFNFLDKLTKDRAAVTALMMFVNIRRMLFNFFFIQKLMIIGSAFSVGTTIIGLFLEIWTAIKYKQLFGSSTIEQRRTYINDLRLYSKL